MTASNQRTSGIRNDPLRGSIGDFLKEKVHPESDLSFVSAYFTIHAYAALRDSASVNPRPIRRCADGSKMDKYNDLLARAVNVIVHTFRKRTAAGLQTGRDFIIPDKREQAAGSKDFELIPWFAIRSEETDG